MWWSLLWWIPVFKCMLSDLVGYFIGKSFWVTLLQCGETRDLVSLFHFPCLWKQRSKKYSHHLYAPFEKLMSSKISFCFGWSPQHYFLAEYLLRVALTIPIGNILNPRDFLWKRYPKCRDRDFPPTHPPPPRIWGEGQWGCWGGGVSVCVLFCFALFFYHMQVNKMLDRRLEGVSNTSTVCF